MEHFLGRDRMRMDLDQGMSVVWFSGDSPRMLMVQHAERRYIEWGAEQLKTMQQVLQRMPTAGAGATGAQQFLRYQGLARAQGLPNGRVVRMNIDADGQPTTITLLSMEPGALAAGRLRVDADAVDPGRPARRLKEGSP